MDDATVTGRVVSMTMTADGPVLTLADGTRLPVGAVLTVTDPATAPAAAPAPARARASGPATRHRRATPPADPPATPTTGPVPA